MVEDRLCVHRYDQRGSGRSRSDGPFDVGTLIADLEALREHWGHERWLVGGHSWGANLALLYAVEHPDRTRAVIYLAGTGLRWGWQASAQRRRLARLTEDERTELVALQRRLARGDAAAGDGLRRLMWTTDFADRDRARALEQRALYEFPRNERVFRAVSESYKAALGRGLEDQVRRLEAPILVIHGAHDAEPERARRVAELAPRGQWVELKHSAHVPWLEEPGELRRALRTFVRQVLA